MNNHLLALKLDRVNANLVQAFLQGALPCVSFLDVNLEYYLLVHGNELGTVSIEGRRGSLFTLTEHLYQNLKGRSIKVLTCYPNLHKPFKLANGCVVAPAVRHDGILDVNLDRFEWGAIVDVYGRKDDHSN